MSNDRLPIAVLISGGGTTLLNLVERIERDSLPIEVRLVVSSSTTAGGLQHAERAGIESLVVRKSDYPVAEEFSEAVFGPCRSRGVQLVVMGGYLKHVLIPADFENRVMNIHPGLIPAFCGRGFYGLRVHRSVLEYGVKVSGCTVHFVDNEYDHGPIVMQQPVLVQNEDTPESLQSRVFEAECDLYPEAIRLFAEGRIAVDGRRVHVS